MQSILSKTNDIEKYCAYSKACKKAEYAKLKTATNDPNISQKMRYSQYLRQSGVRCNKQI